MIHYVCTGGCKGVSDKQGECVNPDCPKHTHPLTPCNCRDGEHKEAYEQDAN